MNPGQSGPGHSDRYWEAIGKGWVRERPQRTWRAHSDAVNRRLLSDWLPAVREGRLLKTDSFDEAVSEGVADVLVARCRHYTGIDVAPETLRRTAKRLAHGSLAAADVRRLPFRAGSFDTVVSLSTLDHFATRAELIGSLRELRRVSAPGATLVLTLDNPSNPLLWLRGALPYRFLNRAGLVPYYVGVTLAPAELCRAVEEAGFAVEETRAILHVPRVLAIALGRWLARWTDGPARARWLRGLMAFERLGHLPTRLRTGHFVAVRARVPGDRQGGPEEA